ncbi:MAG TPA: CCA tRNA nucleotidyltransferase [Limnobacter sp.]|nr:CCA tRNA nucleotidyltransferase [Limnobacter sp.]
MSTPQLSGFKPDSTVAALPAHVQVYVVGGAVRDELLGRPKSDRDWVVVGATPQLMLQAGFKAVGADFPVFLHPITQEEYALARTERKSGHGYKGFVFYADADVTLEQDLLRRDFSINAMAMNAQGQLLDPLSGLVDLQARVFRHVSNAFVEDPLRVLRLARFLARFTDFRVEESTLGLCEQLRNAGELQHLVAERVFAELHRGMAEAKPSRMVALLKRLQAWPALAAGLPEPFSDLSLASLDLLDAMPNADTRWWYCLGLHMSPQQIVALAKHWRMPLALEDAARVTALIHGFFQQTNPSLDDWLSLFNSVDVYRKPARVLGAVDVMMRTGLVSNSLDLVGNAASQVLDGEFKQGLRKAMQSQTDQSPAAVALAHKRAWVEALLVGKSPQSV